MSFRHLSYILSGAAVLLLAATACTQDELADGTRLPEGEYPLIINATGLSVEATPASRATVDGNWDGVTSVALSLGDETKEYSVTASATDGYKTATLSNNLSPFWWTSRNDITVSAWWPYDPTNIPKHSERLCSQRLHFSREPDGALRQPDFGVQPSHGAYNG